MILLFMSLLIVYYNVFKSISGVEITEKGFHFHELGLVDRRTQARKEKWLDNFDGTIPSVREVNLIDVESDGSSSPEESPQNYKPAEYLLIYKK